MSVSPVQEDIATQWASDLLRTLGMTTAMPHRPSAHPQVAWAESGAMALTGDADGSPLGSPVPLASCAEGTMLALQALEPDATLPAGPRLLGERAACSGLARSGSTSPSGSCRLLDAADGKIAVNLPRPDDWSLLPALLETASLDTWEDLAHALRRATVATVCYRAKLLGMAVAAVDAVEDMPPWCSVRILGQPVSHSGRPPRVIDLSSLWAGPLCGQLFCELGADVIKVESITRPDGARFGPATFFDLLNGQKRSVALDFNSNMGIDALLALLRHADIVIEGSRPRALRQLGIDAEALVREHPGKTWISITGYGREKDGGSRIAFGDDAGVAAGLTRKLASRCGRHVFCADAVADPLTGMHAALAGWASWRSGGGKLLDISLAGVVARCVQQPESEMLPVSNSGNDWIIQHKAETIPVQPPSARQPRKRAASLGEHTDDVITD